MFVWAYFVTLGAAWNARGKGFKFPFMIGTGTANTSHRLGSPPERTHVRSTKQLPGAAMLHANRAAVVRGETLCAPRS